MKKAVLIFPDVTKLAPVVAVYQLYRVKVNDFAYWLSGVFTEDPLVIACTQYRAYLERMNGVE